MKQASDSQVYFFSLKIIKSCMTASIHGPFVWIRKTPPRKPFNEKEHQSTWVPPYTHMQYLYVIATSIHCCPFPPFVWEGYLNYYSGEMKGNQERERWRVTCNKYRRSDTNWGLQLLVNVSAPQPPEKPSMPFHYGSFRQPPVLCSLCSMTAATTLPLKLCFNSPLYLSQLLLFI